MGNRLVFKQKQRIWWLEITSLLRICNNETEANYMDSALIKIVSRFDFEYMNLDDRPYTISIREEIGSVR